MKLIWSSLVIALVLTAVESAQQPQGYFDNQPEFPALGAVNQQPDNGQGPFWGCHLGNKMAHTEDCFRDLNQGNYADFLRRVIPQGRQQVVANINPEFIKSINEKDIAACKSERCIKLLAELVGLGKLQPSVFKSLSNFKFVRLLWHLFTGPNYQDGDQVDIPEAKKRLEKLATQIPKKLIVDNAAMLQFFGLANHHFKVQQYILENSDACFFFDQQGIEYILTSKLASHVTPECMRNMDLTLPQNLGNSQGSLQKNVFEKTFGLLSAPLTRKLTQDHVANFGKVPFADKPGAFLEFNQFSKPSVAKGITPALLLHRIAQLGHGASAFTTADNKNYANELRRDLFKSIKREDELYLANLNGDDLNKMPVELIQDIVSSHPAICSRLTENRSYAQVKVTRACFNNMTPRTQATALVSAAGFDEDILTNVTQQKYGEWEVTFEPLVRSTCKDNCKGLGIFTAMAKAKGKDAGVNLGAIISHFGEDPSGGDPCIGLGDVLEISQHTAFATNMSARCFNAEERQFPTEEADLKKVNGRLKFLRPYHVLANVEGLFKGFTQADLQHAVSGGQFCYALEFEDFAQIPKNAYPAFTSSCLQSMSFLDKLTADHIQSFAENSFDSFSNDRLTDNIIHAMTPAQIAHACTKNADANKNNLGAVLTEAHVSGFSEQKVGAITATQWKACKPEAFRGISEAKVKAIKPEAMVHWTESQVKVVPKDAWKSLNKDQAHAIAKDVPAEQAPFNYLLSLNEVDENVKQVLRERAKEIKGPKAEEREEEKGISVWIWVAIGVGAVAILGIAAYFFFRSS